MNIPEPKEHNPEPMTRDEFERLGRELEGCHFVASQAINAEEQKRANDRMLEIEELMFAAPFEYDGDGNLITPEPAQTPEPAGYWWCPNCKEEIGAYHVTYQEKHESCGHSVEWITPPTTESVEIGGKSVVEQECPYCNSELHSISARIAELERELQIERGESAESKSALEDQDEEVARLKAENEQLRAELAEARKDSERFKKLEGYWHLIHRAGPYMSGKNWVAKLEHYEKPTERLHCAALAQAVDAIVAVQDATAAAIDAAKSQP